MLEEDQKYFLRKLQESELYIIVEGKKDRKVLEKGGLSNIIEISGKRLEDVVDIVKKFKRNSVLILTDYDREGIKTYKRLKRLLVADEIYVDDFFRQSFKKIFWVNKIEELNAYMK